MADVGINIKTEHGRHEITYLAFAFFFGILVSSMFHPGMAIIACGFLLAMTVVFINRRSSSGLKTAILLIVFLSGVLDYRLAVGLGSGLDALSGRDAVYECIIIDDPVDRGSYVQYTARCRSVVLEEKVYNFRDKVFFRLRGQSRLKYGDLVKVSGRCEDIATRRNPGDFDYRMYYKSKGINKIITSESFYLLKSDAGNMLARVLHLSKDKVRDTINTALPNEEASILVGIITGDKADIDEETRNGYVKSGLSHILSVSGLHVGFLMLLVTYALRPFKLSKKTEGIITVIVILYYILLIGAPLPSVRAMIMLLVLLAGKITGHRYNLLSSVSFAALLILVFKPLAVHDPGCMISFASMYSIAFLYEPMHRKLRRVPGLVRDSMALSVSVWLGLAPVLIHYFNYISFISIIINIVAVPLAFAITIAGFIGVLTGLCFKFIALYIFSVDYYLIGLLTEITRTVSAVSFSGMYIPSLPIYFYAIYYIAVFIIVDATDSSYIKAYKKRIAVSCALAFLLALFIYVLPSKDLKVIFFDVGQGDSSCIITPDKKAVLIDGGGTARNADYYYDVGGKVTLPALLHQGIWKIDTVIVSHFHDDHMEGLISVLKVYDVKNLIIPKVSASPGNVSPNSELLLELCREKGVKIYKMGNGDSIRLCKEGRIDFLFPEGSNSGGDKADENNNSLVGRLVYKNFRLLYAGDIGKAVEAKLLRASVNSDVLKVPHHGSANSSTEEFLKTATPVVSIISVGRNNFGHPSPQALERLGKNSGNVYRTDKSGAVVITTDGSRMKVETVKQ